jgi:hypothetical protein
MKDDEQARWLLNELADGGGRAEREERWRDLALMEAAHAALQASRGNDLLNAAKPPAPAPASAPAKARRGRPPKPPKDAAPPSRCAVDPECIKVAGHDRACWFNLPDGTEGPRDTQVVDGQGRIVGAEGGAK